MARSKKIVPPTEEVILPEEQTAEESTPSEQHVEQSNGEKQWKPMSDKKKAALMAIHAAQRERIAARKEAALKEAKSVEKINEDTPLNETEEPPRVIKQRSKIAKPKKVRLPEVFSDDLEEVEEEEELATKVRSTRISNKENMVPRSNLNLRII